MHSDSPFLTAQNKLVEGCNWLEELTRPAADPRNECDNHADAWEQANAHISGAIAELEDHGTERLESGGEDVPGHGWIPAYATVVTDPDAVEAANALKALFAPLQALGDVEPIVAAVTPECLAALKAVLLPFESRLAGERECLAAQPDPY